MQLRLMTYNILQGGIGREDLILEVIEANQPDIIILQELNNPLLLKDLAAKLKMHMFFAKANLQLTKFGNTFKLGRRNIGVLSRFPIIAANSYNPFPIRRTLLEATIEYKPGQQLTVFGIHLTASLVLTAELWRSWEVTTILQRVKTHQSQMSVLAGDFNTLAKNDLALTKEFPKWLKLSLALQAGKIYRLALAKIKQDGFIDCYRSLHPTETGLTLPTPKPNTRLDYIFASPKFASYLKSCQVVASPASVHQASDHYPVIAGFDLSLHQERI
jgi:exodeoxyribonuclease-3